MTEEGVALLVYLGGLLFLVGTVVGEGGRVSGLEIATVLGWPVMLPWVWVMRWRRRRRRAWWNSLSYEERDLLHAEGRGVLGLVADLGWWCIHGETLLGMLREVADGGDPDLVYAEHYVNAEREEPG